MYRFYKTLSWILCGFLMAASAAPIRVGIFKGTGGGSSYWHPSIHPGSAAIAAMLANPAQANLANPPIPVQGFTVTVYGHDSACTSGCKPSVGKITAFINALDSLDVVIFPNNVKIGDAIVDSVQRQRLATFWMTKGVVSLHWSSDSYNLWAAWDSVHGTKFQNWQLDGNGTVRLDTVGYAKQHPSWRFLNRGLPDTANFREEWISFAHTGTTIRSRSSLIPTINIDENSLASMNGQAMGDHPLSWYREFPEGGRFFYTGMGHRPQTYDSVYFFRRQLYNAILWAAGADSNGVVSARPAESPRHVSPFKIGVSGSRILVQVAEKIPFTVNIHGLDGKRVASQQQSQAGALVFSDLRPHTVYIVTISTPRSRESRRILLD